MFLTGITLKNFKRFKEQHIPFHRDITVVKGKNEQGKSSIIHAIVAGFYYDPSSSAKIKIGEGRSWDSEELYTIAMGVEDNGEAFSVVKDFEKRTAGIEAGGKYEESKKEAAKIMEEVSFFSKEELFKTFAIVAPQDILIEKKEKGDMKAMLQNLISGSEASPSEIVKKIEKKLKGVPGNAAYPGLTKEIPAMDTAIAAFEKEILEKTKKLKITGETLFSLTEKQEKKAAVTRDSADLKKQIDDLSAYHTLAEQIKTGSASLSEMEKIKSAVDEKAHKIGEKTAVIDTLSFLESVDAKEVRKQLKESEHFSLLLDEVEHEIEDVKNDIARITRRDLMSFDIPVVVLFLAGFLGALINWYWYSFWVLLAALVAYKIFFKIKTKREMLKEKLLRRKDIATQFETRRAYLSPVLTKMGAQDAEEFEEKLRSYIHAREELSVIEKDIAVLLRGKSLERMKSDYQELVSDVERKKLFVAGLERSLPHGEKNIHSLEQAMQRLVKEERMLSEDIVRLESDVRHGGVTAEDIVRDDEYLVSKKEEKKRKEVYVRSLEVLKQMMQEAQALSQIKIRDTFKELIERYIAEITDNKYSAIKLDDDLAISVYSNEKKGWVSPEAELSQGAMDQIYFVARVAFLKMLSEGRRTLLLLDDPFGSFDADRKQKTKNILRDLTEYFQIILFTCTDDFDSWGEVVEL